MATYEQLIGAARRADAAGDAGAAKRFLELAKAAGAPKGADAMRASGLRSPDPTAANDAALAAMFPTNVVEQVGSGTSEGIANALGFPVDMMTKGINAAGGAVGLPPIETPFGGSEMIQAGLAPFISDVQPQTPAQRVGRRVGQDVGAGAALAPIAGVNTLGGLALNTASDALSGIAGGVTSEHTDNPTINAAVSLLAGMAPVAASKGMRTGPQAPTNDALRAREDALWERVRDSRVRLTPGASQELKGNVSAKAFDMKMKPSLHGPEATASIDEVWSLPDRPTLWEIEEARRFIGENTPAAFEKKSTARITTGLKREIDAYLDDIPHPDADIAREARTTSRRRIASEKLDRSIDKAERRAAATGTGGNTINTPRQNLNRILDSPKESASFTKAELEAMDAIARGRGGTNAARWVGALSPDRGGLPLMLNLAGAGGSAYGLATGNPGLAAATAAPGVIGYIAKALGEHLTEKQIKNLSAMVRNGGPVAPKRLTEGEQAVLNALLASQAVQATQP